MVARGARVVQSVRCPTLGFGSGHDLTVYEFEPHVRLYAIRVEPAWDSLSPSLFAPPLCTLSLSVSKTNTLWGTCVAQSVKRPTLDFGSGHDLMVCWFEPRIRLCADNVEPA